MQPTEVLHRGIHHALTVGLLTWAISRKRSRCRRGLQYAEMAISRRICHGYEILVLIRTILRYAPVQGMYLSASRTTCSNRLPRNLNAPIYEHRAKLKAGVSKSGASHPVDVESRLYSTNRHHTWDTFGYVVKFASSVRLQSHHSAHTAGMVEDV